jgi:glutamate 5-kinase
MVIRKRIVIKIGSADITNNGNGLDGNFIREIARQVNELIIRGFDVVIVTSGAVASDPNRWRSRNLRSMVGQPMLMLQYILRFNEYGLEAGQLVVEDKDFENIETGKPNQVEENILESFREKVTLVVNFNDGTSKKETDMMPQCADNDITAKNVCMLPNVHFDYLIVITDEYGVRAPDETVVPLVDISNYEEVIMFANGGNEQGFSKVGMRTKIKTCREVALAGKKAIIIPGRKVHDSILHAVNRLEGRDCFQIGTMFI